MKKKRFLALLLILILIPCFSIFSFVASADHIVADGNPTYDGYLNYNGDYISGDWGFITDMPERLMLLRFELPSFFVNISTSENTGYGTYLWQADIWFVNPINVVYAGTEFEADPFDYQGFRITLYQYGSSDECQLQKLQLISRIGARTLFEYNYMDRVLVVDDLLKVMRFGFGETWNQISNLDYNQRGDALFLLCGDPFDVYNGQRGILQPYVFNDPTGGDISNVGTIGGYVLQFLNVILNGFENLLEIEFLGGFFSLGTLFGVIVGFALIRLFLKYFAGG